MCLGGNMKQYLLVASFVICFFLYGCTTGAADAKLEDLDYTIVEAEDVPEELMKLIEEKKEAPFTLTYTDKERLYIVSGYGVQSTGGYSIEVPELYLTKENIVIDTNLIGPEEKAVALKSYPYVVVMTEFRDLPVLFQ